MSRRTHYPHAAPEEDEYPDDAIDGMHRDATFGSAHDRAGDGPGTGHEELDERSASSMSVDYERRDAQSE